MTEDARGQSPWSSGCGRTRLSVWTCQAEQSADRRYVAGTEADDEGIGLSIAAHAIDAYSWPGATVVDPDCGAGNALVEAVHAGRHVVGMTASARWWRVARGNLSEAKRAGAWPDACVVDAGRGAVRLAGLGWRADLVLTGLRLGRGAGGLGPDSDFESGLRARVRLWTSLLRPGGHAVVIVRPWRSPDGTLLDVPTAVFGAAAGAGLIAVDRCVGMTARIRGDRVVVHASDAERKAVDRARAFGAPIGLAAHHTVVVLRAPDVADRTHDASWERALE